MDLLIDLPDLEFLSVNTDPPSVAFINGLGSLRGLALSGFWKPELDFQKLPHLEWFASAETPRGGLDSLYRGHGTLRHLRVGRYRESDLLPLRNLPALEYLEVFVSRTLTSLSGADVLDGRLKALVLTNCPAIESLEGIEALTYLEYLAIDTCKRVADLAPVARLQRLKFLNIGLAGAVESLGPITGHPSLEVVYYGPIKDRNLDPLATIPHLRLTHSGGGRFNRPTSDFPRLQDLSDDSPLVQWVRSMQLG